MYAKDIMNANVLAVREDDSIEDVIELLIGEHIHGVPVVDPEDRLVGIVTQQDVFLGRTGHAEQSAAPMTVREIMTAPAVSAGEMTDVVTLCRTMHRLRIHRLPIVRDGAIAGVVSSLDICAAIARGDDVV